MAEARFYHLQRTGLEQALPRLLAKTLERGWRAVVLAGSAERVEALNQHLWTYDANAFLPHGSERDGFAAEQPVWLSAHEENPNQAQVLFLVDGCHAHNPEPFQLVCDLFDGNDPAAVAAARERWRRLKAAGLTLSYWQQNERGGWECKA